MSKNENCLYCGKKLQYAQHEMVVLNFDKPVSGLFAGDVGAVVHVYSNGAAYEVEFVDGDGTTVACITLDAKDIRSIKILYWGEFFTR